MLYVENTYGHSISVVDTKSFKVVGTIELDEEKHPDDVAVTKDGKILYCNMTSDGGHSHPLARGDTSYVAAFDTATLKELWRIPIKGHAGHMTISNDNRYLYNTLFDRWFVARVDLQTQEVVEIPVSFNGGHGIRISDDDKRLYVGSILMSKLDLVDLEKHETVKSFLFRDNVRPFHFTKDERTMFVQQSWMHGFHVVDVEANRILRTIALPTLPPETPVIDSYPHTVDHGLEVTPDGKHMVVLASTGNYAAIYSLPDLTLVKTIRLGGVPNWITIDSTGTYAYASNRITDDISVIDLRNFEEIERIKVGRVPQRMCVTD
jgi:YVTN family beta-propeller protein